MTFRALKHHSKWLMVETQVNHLLFCLKRHCIPERTLCPSPNKCGACFQTWVGPHTGLFPQVSGLFLRVLASFEKVDLPFFTLEHPLALPWILAPQGLAGLFLAPWVFLSPFFALPFI
jgi:hypothetical protein